jgi:hypothetical protein
MGRLAFTHAAHDSQHVIINRKKFDLSSPHRGATVAHAVDGLLGQSDVHGGGVDAGEVAGAGGLVLLGLETERVHVDADLGHVLVVLVGLHQVEVQALTLGKPVVAVQLKLGGCDGVGAGAKVDGHQGVEGTTSGHTGHLIDLAAVDTAVDDALPVIGEVEPLETIPAVTILGYIVGKVLGLHDPNDFFYGMIEVQFDLVVNSAGALVTSELQLLNRFYSISRRRLDYILSSR